MTSMLHETFDEKSHAKLYEYLLQDDDDCESLPELDASTTASSRMTMESPRLQSMNSLSRNSKRRLSPPRRHFGWTPSSSIVKRKSTDGAAATSVMMTSSPLLPYLKKKHDDTTEDSLLQQSLQECRELQRQLQQIQDELSRIKQQNETRLEEQSREYEERLQGMQEQHTIVLQKRDEYQEVLIQKLQQRDEQLESNQTQLENMQQQLEEERKRNDVLEQQLEQNMTYSEENDESISDKYSLYDLHANSTDSLELHAKIDECERELQELGLDIERIQHDDKDEKNSSMIPREIQTQPPEQQQHSPMVTCSMDLAHSLVGLLSDASISREEEEVVLNQLVNMAHLLRDDDTDEYHDEIIDNVTVPLSMYQRLEHYCSELQEERADLKREILECMASTRTAHALQLQILIQEVKEEAQRQVYAILNGKQKSQVIQLDSMGESL